MRVFHTARVSKRAVEDKDNAPLAYARGMVVMRSRYA